MSEQPRPPMFQPYPDDAEMGRVMNAANSIAGEMFDLRSEVRQLRHEVDHDPKTGLLSETKFHKDLEEAIDTLKPGERIIVWVGDLDGFKAANDGLTHKGGDELLGIAGTVLTQVYRREGEMLAHGSEDADKEGIARLGGDEFAGFSIIRPDTDPFHAQRTTDINKGSEIQSERFNQGMEDAVAGTKFENYPIKISIGAAEVDTSIEGDVKPGLAAFMQADVAMYAKKYARKKERITPEDKEYLRDKAIPILDAVGHRVEDWLRDAVAA